MTAAWFKECASVVFIRINGGGSKHIKFFDQQSDVILKDCNSHLHQEKQLSQLDTAFPVHIVPSYKSSKTLKDLIQQRQRSNDADFQVKEN
jgi:hypothetical protein